MPYSAAFFTRHIQHSKPWNKMTAESRRTGKSLDRGGRCRWPQLLQGKPLPSPVASARTHTTENVVRLSSAAPLLPGRA